MVGTREVRLCAPYGLAMTTRLLLFDRLIAHMTRAASRLLHSQRVEQGPEGAGVVGAGLGEVAARAGDRHFRDGAKQEPRAM